MDDVELIGGPEKRTIIIEPYSPTWAATFEVHRRRIADALDAAACRVDHIGSTAVASLAATCVPKPASTGASPPPAGRP
jgi:GrpB-like predicted nucleotidyltransferase (UPF0157 family)